MRIGLVGLGDAGRHHARALGAMDAAGEITWAAACGRDEAKARRFCEEQGAPASVRAFGSLDALLADGGLDAVVLATPDGVHVEHALAALSRGLHVLVEKPLALDPEGARRVISAARDARRTLAVGYHLRYHPGHRIVRERLAEIGTLRRLEARWTWPDPATTGWRAHGVGAHFWSLAALGTHLVDLALWLTGETEVTRVSADVRRKGSVDVAADATLRFASGIVAEIGVSVEYRSTPRLSLVGDGGEIECLRTLGARGGGEIVMRSPRGETAPLPFSPADPYLAMHRSFVASARRGSAPGPAEEAAVLGVELLDRIARAGEAPESTRGL
jgi:1,5-anhydro-D-fructose reductase (1,5-anhydro-D-mannitol-forming)